MLKIINLKKSFFQGSNQIEVIKNISLNIITGSQVALLGQSGSGKSTLLTLMSGLDKPDSGEIWINNLDIVALNEAQMTSFRSQNIGIVFQQFHLVSHLTALENVMLPMEIVSKENSKLIEQQAKELLFEVGLDNRLHHLPNQLSGGECQRVAIARSLITKPKLLLADEPSGNLDTETGNKVMNLFFSITRKYKTTTVLVTHNESLSKECDEIFHLENGSLKNL